MHEYQRPHYKHYIGVTSQVNFCQVPLRLDSFNQCSFACSYCFAKSRGGYRGSRKLQVSRPENLEDRFDRISDGTIKSAVDEFLARRIPIQFGGMTDPFSSFEQQYGATRELLRILSKHRYPTLISTKSATLLGPDYVELLRAGNILVRFSISVVRRNHRARVERGTPPLKELLQTIHVLASRGIKCAVRLQPIIPGHERFAFELVRCAKNAGAKHVTFEYLKLPVDDLGSQICNLTNERGEKLIDLFRRSGAARQGRELVLSAAYKAVFLSEISKFAREQKLSVGFGDNEFLPYSDGRSCCNGADLYLNNLNLFESNPASLIRRKRKQELIEFKELVAEWIPDSKIGTYLNSKVRPKGRRGELDWRSYLMDHWKVGAIYSPDFFHGVLFSGISDDNGMPIFVRLQDTF